MLITVVVITSAVAVAANRLLLPFLSLVAIAAPKRADTALRIIEMLLKHRWKSSKPPDAP